MKRSRRSVLGGLSVALAGVIKPAWARRITQFRSGSSSVGPPPGTVQGTTYGFRDLNAAGSQYSSPVTGFVAAVTGTITLSMANEWIYGFSGTGTAGTLTAQWYLDETPIGSQVSATGSFSAGCPPLSLSFNTTTVLDGTHMVWLKFLDHTTDQAYAYGSFGSSLIVHNTGFSTAAQTVPATTGNQVRFVLPNRPDYVAYPGGGGTPSNTAVPFTDGSGFIAPQAGVAPPVPSGAGTSYFLRSITNPNTEEYKTDPMWSTLASVETGSVDGGVWIQNISVEDAGGTQGTGASDLIYFKNIGLNPADGGRCVNLISGIITLVPAPDGSAWYGVELQGSLFKLDYTGARTTIAGYTKDMSKLTYRLQLVGNDPSNEGLFRTRQTLVGNFTGGANDIGTAIDLCFDTRDSNIIYVCLQGDCQIMKVDMTGFPGTPATITPYAGTGSPGYSDNSTATLAEFDNPNSIIMDGSGNMYVADTNNCVIRKIASPSAGVSGAVTTFLGYQSAKPSRAAFEAAPLTYSPDSGSLAFSTFAGPSPTSYIPYPFTIRFTSNGDILIFQNENVQVRRLNLGSSTVTHIGYFGGTLALPGDAWGWMAVDAAGAIGTTDNIYLAQALSISGGAEYFWVLPIGGGTGIQYGDAYGISGEPDNASDQIYFFHGWGHYPWAAAVSNLQGRAIFTGVSDRGVHEIHPYQTNDPIGGAIGSIGAYGWANFNQVVNLAGQYIWCTGTVAGRGPNTNGWPNGFTTPMTGWPRPFPFNIRPSFTSIHGNNGNGFLGNQGRFAGASSFDAMLVTYSTEATLRAFVQAGMGGSTPRYEITGNDWRDLYYYIRINSIAGSTDNGGVAVQPGADDPDTGNYPTIISLMAARATATSINVNWITDKPCLGFAAAGTAAQQAFTTQYPVFSEVEAPISGPTFSSLSTPLVYPTSHMVTIHDCPSGQGMYVIVVAKDMAGNSVHSTQVFVT